MRYLVHDESNIGFYSADLNVSLISSQFVGRIVVIRVYKKFDDYSVCFGIVVDYGVGDIYTMNILQSLDGLAQREFEVYPIGKTQPYDIVIILFILERGCTFGKRAEVHVEDVHRELPLEIP